jgi:predicted DNA-binding transcriptional regulator AlpA
VISDDVRSPPTPPIAPSKNRDEIRALDTARAKKRAKRLRREREKALSGRAEVKPAVVTVREFMLTTGLSHATIYRCIKDGSIASTFAYGRRLIPFSEVERLRDGRSPL